MLQLSWVVLCALTFSICFFSTRSQAVEDLPAASNFTGGWHQISPKLHIWCYTSALSAGYVGTDPGELALCDCEVATGPRMAFLARRRGGLFPALSEKGPGCAAPIPPSSDLCRLQETALSNVSFAAAADRGRPSAFVTGQMLSPLPPSRATRFTSSAEPRCQASGCSINRLSQVFRPRQ